MFTKKGICTRNAETWPDEDYSLITFCGFSAVKVMGHTEPQLSDEWGMRVRQYHRIVPERNIFILEAGNSNAQSGYPLTEEMVAREFWDWFTRLKDLSYVGLACPFLLSSPSQEWTSFTWRDEGSGRYKEVVHRLRYWS